MKVKKINKVMRPKTAVVLPILLAALSSQAGINYAMNKSVIAGGGGESKSSTYVLNGVIGQSTTTQSASVSYQMAAGFIQENRDLIFFNEFEINN